MMTMGMGFVSAYSESFLASYVLLYIRRCLCHRKPRKNVRVNEIPIHPESIINSIFLPKIAFPNEWFLLLSSTYVCM